MKSKLAMVLAMLLSVFVGNAFGQKRNKSPERKILGDELAFGRKAAEFGLWNEAIFRWERIVAADPTNAQALNNLAVAYESVGNYEKAGSLYQSALDLDEDSQDIRKNLKRFRSFYRKHQRQLAREAKLKEKKKSEAEAANNQENQDEEGGG